MLKATTQYRRFRSLVCLTNCLKRQDPGQAPRRVSWRPNTALEDFQDGLNSPELVELYQVIKHKWDLGGS